MIAIRKALLAVLVLAILVALHGNAAPIPGIKAGGEDGDKWLVDDAEFVMVINFKQMLGSDLVKKRYLEKIREKLKEDEKAKEFTNATGLDLTKDVDSIIVSGSGSSKETMKARFVVKGDFDVAKLTKKIKENDKVSTSKVGTVELFEIEAQGQTLYAAFAGKNALVMTESKDSTVALAKDGPTKAAKIGKELKSALNRFTGKESFAMAMVVTEKLKELAAAAPQPAVKEAIKSLQTVTVGATVTEGVTLNVVGALTDAEAAKKLEKQLTGLKAVGELTLGGLDNVPQVAKDVVEGIKIDKTRDTVTITVTVTKEQVEKAEKLGGGS